VLKIGRYEVEVEIGRGSMGVVYLAHDPRVLRRLAVKTYHLPEGISPQQQREYRERFLREAQAAGRLSHPAIVTLYDADEDPDTGTPFIAMEYLAGQSLQELLDAKGRIEPERALAMAGVLADALHVAHEAGIVHRDIKPANILVSEPDGAVKITDFGIARLSTSTLTQTGEALGSPAYMSPEQIRGETVDARSDLFCLAIILYQTLTGERPFAGEDISSLVYSIAHETPVPVTKRVKGLPPGIDGFFDRALAKDPDDRFPNGAAFRRALGEAQDSRPSESVEATVIGPELSGPFPPGPEQPPARTKRRRGRTVVMRGLMGVGLILALGLGGWLLQGGEEKGESYLILGGRSKLEKGTLTLLLDDEEVYSRRLAAPRIGPKILGKKRIKVGQEVFEARIGVGSGRHKVVAYVEPEGKSSGYRRRAYVDLEPGESLTLRLEIGRDAEEFLSLELD
jgi:serine/threonine protein kinase